MENLKNIERTAQLIVELFYPFVEVSLLSFPAREEIVVYNRFSKDLSKEASTGVEQIEGRQFKTAETVLYNSENAPMAYFRVRFEISIFSQVQKQLLQLIGKEPETAPWEEQIQGFIKKFLKEHHKTLEALDRKEKQDLVLYLYEQEAFKYKDAAHYLATLLQTSRATIYNYLKRATLSAGLHIHQVDAFTEERFSGNPAGVVLDAETINEDMMRKITREMNLSETAFVLPSSKADFRIRYFTPTGHEVSFCGHSTVGALYMLAHEKRMGIQSAGQYTFTMETLAGVLTIKIEVAPDEKISVYYDAPQIDLVHATFSKGALLKALGLEKQAIDASKPLMYEKTNRDAFIAVPSLEVLKNLSIDLKGAEAFSKKHNIVAFCFLTPETFHPENQVHIRCFAPAVGIPEDPFTGSVLGGLVAYLCENGMQKEAQGILGAEQGHFINRPGNVKIQFKKIKNRYSATIIAKAVHLFSTRIHL